MILRENLSTNVNGHIIQHQVKFEPTVKLAVYTVDSFYENNTEEGGSIHSEFNIAFIPHHDRIKCTEKVLKPIMNATGFGSHEYSSKSSPLVLKWVL